MAKGALNPRIKVRARRSKPC